MSQEPLCEAFDHFYDLYHVRGSHLDMYQMWLEEELEWVKRQKAPSLSSEPSAGAGEPHGPPAGVCNKPTEGS